MTFPEWIKLQIEALRGMLALDDGPSIPPDGVTEIRSGDQLLLQFRSSTANLSKVRKAIEKFCEATALDLAARDEIGLVVNEALANIIRHAYGNAKDRPIELRAEPYRTGVRLKIRDWGTGVDPTGHARPEHDPLVPGGLGLICLKRLMDEMKFEPQHDGMLLELVRFTPGSRAASGSSVHPA